MMPRLFVTGLTVACSLVLAEDWPQWRGSNRTGISQEKGLLQEWPKEGPKQLWHVTGIGDG